jgi:hypothetical protein
MLTTYTFWTHGVNTIVQDQQTNGVKITHSGGGTNVKMPANTTTTRNFLHIPIPTPTALELSSLFPEIPSVICTSGRLRATVNNNVLIKSVQFLVDGVSMFTSESIPVSGPNVNQPLDCNDFIVMGGLVLSLTVDFLPGMPGTPGGMITILGAGATFKVPATV